MMIAKDKNVYASNNFSSLVQNSMEKMHVDIKDNLKDKGRGHQNEKSETEKKDIAASLDFFCWSFLLHPFF